MLKKEIKGIVMGDNSRRKFIIGSSTFLGAALAIPGVKIFVNGVKEASPPEQKVSMLSVNEEHYRGTLHIRTKPTLYAQLEDTVFELNVKKADKDYEDPEEFYVDAYKQFRGLPLDLNSARIGIYLFHLLNTNTKVLENLVAGETKTFSLEPAQITRIKGGVDYLIPSRTGYTSLEQVIYNNNLNNKH